MKIQGLQILAENLVERGFLLETRTAVARRFGRDTSIEIGDTTPLNGEKLCAENSVTYYLESLRQNRLSWLLFDGSIVQVSYRFRGKSITYHRYCYIPAPFDLDLRMGGEAEIGEWIESMSTGDPLNAPRRSSLRFEFDPLAQTVEHAAAHLHMNSPDCRIPMRGPLSVREFVSFLVRFFYVTAFPADLCSASFDYDSTISEAEERGFHLGWRRAAGAVAS